MGYEFESKNLKFENVLKLNFDPIEAKYVTR